MSVKRIRDLEKEIEAQAIEVGMLVRDNMKMADIIIKLKPQGPKGKTIGIVGSRRRSSVHDWKAVLEALENVLNANDGIVSGGCPQGADSFAERIAKDKGLTIIIHYPNWKKHGRNAGLIRNDKIARCADVLIACVADDRKGGTEDTIRKFEKRGKKAILV